VESKGREFDLYGNDRVGKGKNNRERDDREIIIFVKKCFLGLKNI